MITVNDYFRRVIVLNLDRREDRMDRLHKKMEVLGIKYLRHSALDAKALDIDPKLACKLSHLQILDKWAGERTLVLEDDALFAEDFNILFDQYIRKAPEQADVLYLGAYIPNIASRPSLETYNEHWAKQLFTSGMHAYSIRPDLMEYYSSQLRLLDGHIDMDLQSIASDKSFICYPNLVTQFSSYSDIRQREVNDFE